MPVVFAELLKQLFNYETIKYLCYAPSSTSSLSASFVQTLTKLDMSGWRIGDRGAQHIAEALKTNTVVDTYY